MMENYDILRIEKYQNTYEFALYLDSSRTLLGETELTNPQVEKINSLCAKLGAIKGPPVSGSTDLGQLLIPVSMYEGLVRNNPLLIFSNEVEIPWELIKVPPKNKYLSLERSVFRGVKEQIHPTKVYPTEGKQLWVVMNNSMKQDLSFLISTDAMEFHLLIGKRIKKITIENALTKAPFGAYYLDRDQSDSTFWGDQKNYYSDILNSLNPNNPPEFLFLNITNNSPQEINEWIELFIKKGIRYIIVPGWYVPHENAANFGYFFLKQLVQTKTIPLALLRAKIEYQACYPNDLSWAAYRSFLQINLQN